MPISAVDLRGELACRDEDEAGGPCLGSSRSTIGTAKASVLPEPVGDFDEHVAAGEGVREDEALDSEWSMDVALGERLRDARGHTQLKERLHWSR